MSNVWKSVTRLIRCDEESLRLNSRLEGWMGGINKVFMGVAEGLPYLQREIGQSHSAIMEMSRRISDDATYMGPKSSRQQVVMSFLQLIEEHRKNENELAEFTNYFKVVREVQIALSSLADLMEDVECFSVNAIVQAHNAGDRGRGFSQVSREVVSLTKRAAVEFERVSSLACDIEQNLADLESEINRSREQFDASPVQGQDDVTAIFKDLDDSRQDAIGQVKKLIDGVSESSDCIGRVLCGLQFEDRCSQISAHLSRSLKAFHNQVDDLTLGDSDIVAAHKNVDGVIDTVALGMGVFEMVGGLVGSLSDELTTTRCDIVSALEGFGQNLNAQADNGLDLDALEGSIATTQHRLEEVVTYMREMVAAKGEIVSRAQGLAGQIRDLRDDLEGVRRTAKRFGVMASIIKVELASAGLSEEFGEALSAERVENLYRDMATAVGSVLIALDSAVKQVQRRSADFRRALVWEEDTLREVDAYTNALVKELNMLLVRNLKQGEASFNATLKTLHRESSQLRADLVGTVEMNKQSASIKSNAHMRANLLKECHRELLIAHGLGSWHITDDKVEQLLASCTVRSQRELVSSVLGGGNVESGSREGDVVLF